MLERGLEHHRQRQLVRVGRQVGMHVVRERHRGVVHGTDGVTGERQHGVQPRRLLRVAGLEDVLLGAPHSLHRHQVRPGARPAAGVGAAVEVDEQPVLGGVAEDVEVEADAVLLVAMEEVHLDAGDAPFGQLGHLGPPRLRVVHAIARRLGHVVVRAAGVVPEEDPDAAAGGVLDQLGDRSGRHLRPVGIHQRVLPAELGGEIDESPQCLRVAGAGLVGPPAPRNPAGFHP